MAFPRFAFQMNSRTNHTSQKHRGGQTFWTSSSPRNSWRPSRRPSARFAKTLTPNKALKGAFTVLEHEKYVMEDAFLRLH